MPAPKSSLALALAIVCLGLLATAGGAANSGPGCDLVNPCEPAVGAVVDVAADSVAAPYGIQPAGRRCRAGSMRLGWQDDDRLLYRQSLGLASDAPFDDSQGERLADVRIDAILDRFAQAGGCLVRLIAFWGATENSDGTWYFDKLDRAVARLRAKGLRVLLTLSGANYECIDSGGAAGLYNPRARACTDDPLVDGDHVPCGAPAGRPTGPLGEGTQTQATSLAPDPGCFARFVRAITAHFRDRGVELFSLWNEPNHPSFLQGTATEQAADILPAARYRALYQAGYRAAKRANPNAKVLIGELSSGPRRGSRFSLVAPRRRVTALEFLSEVASPGGELQTDGVAWHPYQHGLDPARRSPAGYTGIGDLDALQRTLDGLWAADRHGRRRLALPSQSPSPRGRPPLLLTEFGYLIRGNSRRPRSHIIDDVSRADWLRRALTLSRAHGAALMVLYTGTEYEPGAYPPARRDDYGIFEKTGAVTGKRSYGRGDRTRRAYCAGVFGWARLAGYPVALDDPATAAAEGPPC